MCDIVSPQCIHPLSRASSGCDVAQGLFESCHRLKTKKQVLLDAGVTNTLPSRDQRLLSRRRTGPNLRHHFGHWKWVEMKKDMYTRIFFDNIEKEALQDCASITSVWVEFIHYEKRSWHADSGSILGF